MLKQEPSLYRALRTVEAAVNPQQRKGILVLTEGYGAYGARTTDAGPPQEDVRQGRHSLRMFGDLI